MFKNTLTVDYTPILTITKDRLTSFLNNMLEDYANVGTYATPIKYFCCDDDKNEYNRCVIYAFEYFGKRSNLISLIESMRSDIQKTEFSGSFDITYEEDISYIKLKIFAKNSQQFKFVK